MDHIALPIPFLSLAFATLFSSAFATDRVVSPTGTYNTISSAIAASGDGDRVLVEPGTYNESLYLTHSISILPNHEGGRFTVSNRVFANAVNGKTITLSGIRILGGLQAIGPFTEPTFLRISDSYLEQCLATSSNLRIELFRDSVKTSVSLTSGSIIGCTILGAASNQCIFLSGTNTFPDPVRIIGNRVGSAPDTSLTGLRMQAIGQFQLENNYFMMYGPASAVVIQTSAQIGTPRSTILNNTFHNSDSTGVPAISHALGYFNVTVKNNAVIFFGQVHDLLPSYTGGVLDASHNVYAGPSAINVGTGAAVGPPLIDAGDPDPRYLDLDLTTNDVGCYGGSNSRANFTTAMGSAVVGFMQAPRVVSQGEPVNISAIGFDR